MELSTQIKDLRRRDGLSQEALAERIYVTRQTVSNWETGKSYPDVQSLLMLSVLFNVSIDHLVKGDVEMMKNELDAYKMKLWSWAMLVLIVIAITLTVPLYMLFGLMGLLVPGILYALALVISLVLERLKKKHNIETYSEIVAFYEGKSPDAERIPWGRKHRFLHSMVKFAGGAAVGLLLLLLGVGIWKLIAS